MPQIKPDSTIDEYIKAFPPDIQAILEQVRRVIHNAAPEAIETMSYGIPTFDLNGNHLVFFAGWKRHVSLYPLPAGDSAFQNELAPYKKAKGSIQFPLGSGVPHELVEKIVRLLIAEKPESAR